MDYAGNNEAIKEDGDISVDELVGGQIGIEDANQISGDECRAEYMEQSVIESVALTEGPN